ncbi:MAG: acyl-CoA dehydrogenase [Deltaproteobacteria bacterium]|nr:acyl-CoA dehydrogenase [Deltaproteobacteria bacterium]
MDYNLTEMQKEIVNLTRKIAVEQIVPVRAELDETGEFPWKVLKLLADAGLFGVYIPEEYGGMGFGNFDNCLVVEELSKYCVGVSVSFAASGLGAYPILLFGSEEQKKKYLPDIAAGKKLGAFGITESGAGSDAAAIRTQAKRDGDSYILDGVKQWITNAGEAETYTVIAKTDKSKGPRGASCFIVEKDTPGFSFSKKENKLGIRASATRELIFEECRVPAENLISKEGRGFIVAMKNFDQTRAGIAAQAVGLAQGALNEAILYAHERRTFGKPIISHQGITHMLADMATQIEASRALTYQAARACDAGAKDMAKYSSMAKLLASETCMRVTTDAVQIFGGYGYMKEYPVEKMMRDAKILQIYEGTSQIQKNVIGQFLIKEAAGKKIV